MAERPVSRFQHQGVPKKRNQDKGVENLQIHSYFKFMLPLGNVPLA